ncbi:MAG: radical SAM protein [Litorimonas sp.]
MELSPPKTLFVEITSECNSRCKYCHMWSLKDGADRLRTEEKLRLVKDFSRLNPNGEVVLTGGEPFLKLEEVFDLFQLCRGVGLICSINTNGSTITQDVVDRLISSGPNHLVISLDSHEPEVHDFHRGVSGGFENTKALILRLVAKKSAQQQSQTEFIINTVITSLNLKDLDQTLRFAESLGVDGVTLQMLSPTFYRMGQYDKFFENYFFSDKPAAINFIQEIIDGYDTYPLLRTTPADLFWMQKYIINPLHTVMPICNSHERNIIIDHVGDVRLCFNMSKIMSGEVLGNVRKDTLGDLWRGEVSRRARILMKECRLSCGMLNCHRNKSL